ncbi:MAG: zf-HC2 domain-containing protein [Gemmatimonadetes bacterium]|nr:zf-HC2 domain-containing protein [Gemmatimonadota bacterium]
MHPEWTDLLSSYLDGELDPVTARRLERHLDECASCREVRDDLAAIVAAAPRYLGDPPGEGVWRAIAATIDADKVVTFPVARPARRWPIGLVAAGVLLAGAAGGGLVWWTTREAPVVAIDTPPVDAALVGLTGTSPKVDAAIAELEAALAANRHKLDTATVRVLEESLATIDRAVAEARVAIQRDSANRYLNNQIAINLRKKAAVLQRATRALAAET